MMLMEIETSCVTALNLIKINKLTPPSEYRSIVYKDSIHAKCTFS